LNKNKKESAVKENLEDLQQFLKKNVRNYNLKEALQVFLILIKMIKIKKSCQEIVQLVVLKKINLQIH
jgi:hypothetical protein